MRSPWRLAGILLCLVLVAACDTTQPLQLESQVFEFSMRAVGAEVIRYNVYDVYRDDNNNNQQDAGELSGLFCEDTILQQNDRLASPTSMPWHFSIEISILRTGETEPEPLTGEGALEVDGNLTDYDTTPAITGLTAAKSPVTVNNTVFRFLNPRRLSAATREVVIATSNPLSTADPGTYGQVGQGLCSSIDPGPSAIDTVEQPLSIQLNKGDTVVIKARRGDVAPSGFVLGSNLVNTPLIKGFLTLSGSEVTIRGDNVSTKDPAAGISFSFTSL